MEIALFVSFVVLCAFVLLLVTGRSRGKQSRARKPKAGAAPSREELLRTPSDYTLSHPDQVWQTRRQSSSTGVTRTNTFVARSLGQDPEYDGYSRRDRHHLRDRNARIKEVREREAREARQDEIGYRQSKAGG